MKGPWKALTFLAAVAGTALVLSTSALALTGATDPASPQWQASLGSATWSGGLNALYPGAANDTEVVPFTITNAGRSSQLLNSVGVSMMTASNGDAETTAGADIPGCRANWFTVSVDPSDRALPLHITAAAAYTGAVDLSMPDSGTNENACQNAAPAFTITAG